MTFMSKFKAGFDAARAAHAERLELVNGDDVDGKLLFLVERSFAKGKTWGQYAYESGDGKRCLVGAMRAMRASHGIEGDHGVELLKRAIEEHVQSAPQSIEDFNDSRPSYREVATVLSRARRLASAKTPARQAKPLLAHAPSVRVATTPHDAWVKALLD